MEIKCKTKEESRNLYREYVQNHIGHVGVAFNIFGVELCELIHDKRESMSLNTKVIKHQSSADLLYVFVKNNIINHDKSKFSREEFDAYAAKFFTSEEDNLDEINKNFDKAWKHHYSINKHHPEYWLIKLDGNNCTNVPMNNTYFIEMILDWISVSMTNKSSVIDWWNSPGGKDEKAKMLPESDIKLLDEWITSNKERLNFKS